MASSHCGKDRTTARHKWWGLVWNAAYQQQSQHVRKSLSAETTSVAVSRLFQYHLGGVMSHGATVFPAFYHLNQTSETHPSTLTPCMRKNYANYWTTNFQVNKPHPRAKEAVAGMASDSPTKLTKHLQVGLHSLLALYLFSVFLSASLSLSSSLSPTSI